MADYSKRATYNENRFYSDDNITEINKQIVKDFMKEYKKADATISLFYTNVVYPLRESTNIKEDFADKTKLVSIMGKLKDNYAEATYKKCIEIVKLLGNYMYGKRNIPESYDHIPKLTKKDSKKLKRASRDDYEPLSWEDGLALANVTSDIQSRAFIMFMLDSGMRPSEAYTVNIGDCTRDGKFIMIKLSAEKTKTSEERLVPIYRASPYLNEWLNAHPDKKNKKAPLWIQRKRLSQNKIVRFTPDTSKRLLLTLSQKAKIGKKVSMYMLRHSAISLAKQERLNPDIICDKFGHSIRFYHSVYGKLNDGQKADIFKAEYGEGKTKLQEEDKSPKICPICNEINEPRLEHCLKCNSPLSLSVALKEQQQNKEILEAAKLIKDIMGDKETLKKLFALKKKAEVLA